MSLTIAELQMRLDHFDETSHTLYFYDLANRMLTSAWFCGQLPGVPQEDIPNIASAARLLDLCRLFLPEKLPYKLSPSTAAEISHMAYCAEYGKMVLNALFPPGSSCPSLIRYAREICMHYHEQWFCTGSHDPLHSEEIPCYIQVVSLADCYDRLRTCRSSRPALSHESAKFMILSGNCGAFKPHMLAFFEQSIDEIVSGLYSGDYRYA